MTLSSYWDNLADYFVTWINDSPNAVDSSAIERRVKFGNPVVHLETTASLLPIFLAKSRWLIFFSLRIESMRAIMSADNWISVRISGDTDESFALNQSCLFLISQKQHHRCHWVLSPQFLHILWQYYHLEFFQTSVSQEHIRIALSPPRKFLLILLLHSPEWLSVPIYAGTINAIFLPLLESQPHYP